MRITITCEDCGRRHRLERAISETGEIWIVCHDCEVPLRALLETVSPAAAAPAGPTPARPSVTFARAWAGTIDMAGVESSTERSA